ncbi:hypothetical protein JEQ20_25280, partial [Klebsiella pneumoniae]|uniref:hypothetical protein n=1 Tax=Klebsiella pneumoniae TaxID=573 RepID=UPI0018E90C2F
ARLQAWDDEDDAEGPVVDLSESQACLSFEQSIEGEAANLRRFELGALLIARHEPAPLQSMQERQLLERVRQRWLGRQQRRHERAELD